MNSEYDGTLVDERESELVRRLRALEWPPVDSEMRDRCWREFELRLESGEAERSEPAPEPSRRNTARRESYTRRVPLVRQPLEGYLRAARPWQELRQAATARRVLR
jgi:hypothetical protein